MTGVVKAPLDLAATRTALDQIRDSLNIDDLIEANARVASARAWAKAHKRIAEQREQLLRIEVEVLARIAELGKTSELGESSRTTAKWLAAMTPLERQHLVDLYSDCVTASSLRTHATRAERAAEGEQRGRDFASRPSFSESRARSESAVDVIRNAVESLMEVGEPFTIADLSDSIVGELTCPDSDVERGVREMCRDVIMRSSTAREVDGTVIPRTLTVEMPDGAWVRIPTERATVSHARQALDARRAQLNAYQAAFRRMERFCTLIETLADGAPNAVIGDLLVDVARAEAAS